MDDIEVILKMIWIKNYHLLRFHTPYSYSSMSELVDDIKENKIKIKDRSYQHIRYKLGIKTLYDAFFIADSVRNNNYGNNCPSLLIRNIYSNDCGIGCSTCWINAISIIEEKVSFTQKYWRV